MRVTPDSNYWAWLKRTNPDLYAKLIATRRHPVRDFRSNEYYKAHPERRPAP